MRARAAQALNQSKLSIPRLLLRLNSRRVLHVNPYSEPVFASGGKRDV